MSSQSSIVPRAEVSEVRVLRVAPRKILDEFECCVCKAYMHPPIPQCLVGHSCCFRCSKQLDNCPTCREDFAPGARSWIMEGLHAKFNFPCENVENGCKEITNGTEILEHELYCRFRTLNCPLGMNGNCDWTGILADTVAHCETHHDNHFFKSPTENFICEDFIRDDVHNVEEAYFLFCHFFGEYFMITWRIDYDTRLTKWCIFLMGKPEDIDTFDFEIKIGDKYISKPACYRGRCPVIPGNVTAELSDSHCFVVHYDLLKNYCNGGTLPYSVRIIKNDS